MKTTDTYSRIISTGEIWVKDAKGMRDIRGREIHNYQEIFLFFGGEAEFICETGRHHLSPRTIVVIPAGHFHQFVVYGNESNYARLVLNFHEESTLRDIIKEKMNHVYLVKDKEAENILLRFQQLCNCPFPEPENGMLMKALLTQLVIILGKENELQPVNAGFSTIVQQALAYVDSHLPDTIHVDEIARALYISNSYLSHCFREELHLSVYRYVLEKRLSLASQMIWNNTQPTVAAAACGFNDYSSFYRQYKKTFGAPPSQSKRES